MGQTDFDGVAVSAADGFRQAGAVMPSRLPVTFRQDANGVLADGCFFIADRAYTVVGIKESHAVAATATGVTMQITKDTGTQGPGAGVDLLATGFDMGVAANTVQSGSLTTAAGALDLATGDRLSADFSATGAPLAGVTSTVMLVPKAS